MPGPLRDYRRYLSRALNSNPFGPAVFPCQQLDLASRYPEALRQKTDQVAVGLAIDRRCCQPDFQAITMCTVKRVGRRSGLDMEGQHQVFTVPLVPLRGQGLRHYPDGMPCFCSPQGAVRVKQPDSFPGGGSFTPYAAPTSG